MIGIIRNSVTLYRELSKHTSEGCSEPKTTSKSASETSNDNSCDMDRSMSDMSQFNKFTNKKQAYLEQIIKDKNGVYKYIDDPVEYKKARK